MADIDELRAELDQEFQQFRSGLDNVRTALDHVEKAGPEDDVYELLKQLEEAVSRARNGGVFGAGAKGHRAAREAYREAKGLGDA